MAWWGGQETDETSNTGRPSTMSLSRQQPVYSIHRSAPWVCGVAAPAVWNECVSMQQRM